MKTWNVRRIVGSLFVLMMAAARAQTIPPTPGLYRIVSGTYSECCGLIAVPVDYPLPRTNLGYLELAVDGQGTSVSLAFLADDLHTVFKAPQVNPDSGFTFYFTNGVVYGDHLQFGAEISIPENPTPFYYTVSNSAEGLKINGTAAAQLCCDIPTQFQHTNVVAIPVAPAATPVIAAPRLAAGGAFQFTVGNGRWGQTNVIEVSANLTNWIAIRTNVFPATACPDCPFIDFEDPDSPRGFLHRFYRSHSLP
jgi:hypothetical protein